jgi:hypothetical protein
VRRIGVLGDVQVALRHPAGVGQERPFGAHAVAIVERLLGSLVVTVTIRQ